MPSPFWQQKYSSQNHTIFGNNTTPAMPEGPKKEEIRRASDASIGSQPRESGERRRSSTLTKFANLHALKRPDDPDHAARRASFTDAKAKPGFIGSLWHNYTRGPSSPPSK
ncbi:hypothetical protein BCR34DRAFT_385150 [Clohesyomyces aquaticus]|uniref:Uncharacterized protein n=1 Tax=Clohesyomyces aquaticus TaxID=1231657 RepID=A0A1Y1ZGB0_9PLEO|nr:hypothetical protein BCR34DRAFT_385150 [Clohesyomyces aquaticus]